MSDSEDSALKARAAKYAALWRLAIVPDTPFSWGQDGWVWKSDKITVVKAHRRETNYKTERDCYQRRESHGVTRLGDFAVPQLIRFDDGLLVIEMQLVVPPFIVDFGKAYIDRKPDFSPEVLQDEDDCGSELFEERWPKVKSLLALLSSYGIHYMDAKPKNIVFAD